MLYTCGKKKYDELEIEHIIAGNGVIPFPEVDSKNPDARLFVGYVRANKEFATDASDLIELLLFPIHEKVSVNTEMYKMLSESNVADSFISRLLTSSDCRISLQLYINSVEKELLNGSIINTNMSYENFRKKHSKVENRTDKHIFATYFISLIIEYVQVGSLSKNKIKIIKNMLRRLNKLFFTCSVYRTKGIPNHQYFYSNQKWNL